MKFHYSNGTYGDGVILAMFAYWFTLPGVDRSDKMFFLARFPVILFPLIPLITGNSGTLLLPGGHITVLSYCIVLFWKYHYCLEFLALRNQLISHFFSFLMMVIHISFFRSKVLLTSLKVHPSLPYIQNGAGRQDRLENKLLPTY